MKQESKLRRWLRWHEGTIILAVFLAAMIWAMWITRVHAGELNPTHSPQISEWFQGLRQPDSPRTSCCGEADAFEADSWKESAGEYFAIITDGRGLLADGTAVRIPDGKNFRENKHNPTGHGIVFLHVVTRSEIEEGYADEADLNAIHVFCYLEPDGA